MSTPAELPNRDRLDELFRGDGYAAELGMRLVDWDGGRSRVAWTPSTDHANFTGVVHGGAVFSLGDVAFSVAGNSWGRISVALTVDVHYLAPPDPDIELVAEAFERNRTRRTGSYQIEVVGGGATVASLHAMLYRTSGWHFGEDAWPEAWRDAH